MASLLRRALDPFGLFDRPEVSEPAANRQLMQSSGQLYNMAREQFAPIQAENRKNMAEAGSRSGRYQAQAGARAMANAGPATSLYGPGNLASSARGLGVGAAMNSVANDQHRRSATGQLGLINDSLGGYSQSLQGLNQISGGQYQNNMQRTQSQIGRMNSVGSLVGLGVGMYGGKQ